MRPLSGSFHADHGRGCESRDAWLERVDDAVVARVDRLNASREGGRRWPPRRSRLVRPEWDLDGLFLRLGAAIDEVGAKRVVIDTIETMFGASSNTALLRGELHRLFRWLKGRGVTAVITAERGDGTLTRYGIEEYVSDCVIVLDHRVSEQASTRRLRILKYRGSLHGTNEYPFLIGDSGMSVLPITAHGLQHGVSSERVSTGVARLDAMLGDGRLLQGRHRARQRHRGHRQVDAGGAVLRRRVQPWRAGDVLRVRGVRGGDHPQHGLGRHRPSALALLLSCPRETIVGSRLSRFLAGGVAIAAKQLKGPDGLGATLELELLDDNGDLVPVLVGASPLDSRRRRPADLPDLHRPARPEGTRARDRTPQTSAGQADRRRRGGVRAGPRGVPEARSLGLLAGGIAHDFNNLLTVILGNTSVALNTLGPVRASRAVGAGRTRREPKRRPGPADAGLLRQGQVRRRGPQPRRDRERPDRTHQGRELEDGGA